MKRDLLTIILLPGISAMVFFLANCGEDGEDPEPNKPPTISITSPSNNAIIEKGETVQINVTASDPDGSVSNVTIYIDNVEEDSFNSPPYSVSVNRDEAEAGSHTVKAVATDNEGLIYYS
jgi:chitinase